MIKQQDSKEVALINEKRLLTIIAEQSWVREAELALLSGMSTQMVARTCSRMANNKLIYRDKKPSGFFLRLRMGGANVIGEEKSGKGVRIPDCWRHHCLAIQCLSFLREIFDQKIKTESSIRKSKEFGHAGKIPDGRAGDIHIEVEWAKKDGQALIRQSKEICRLASFGTPVVMAYPFRNDIYDKNGIQISGTTTNKRNHERTQASAIRRCWGTELAPEIKFLRCIFKNELAYDHAKVERFELIDLPGGYIATKIIPAYLLGWKIGYQWIGNDLMFNKDVVEKVEFYYDERYDVDVAIFRNDEYGNRDHYSDVDQSEYFNFEVFFKNAILISKRENILIDDVLSRHIDAKYPHLKFEDNLD